MEYMAIAQGRGITPHSFKDGGGPALFNMQLGADKVSTDCTWQIECKVKSVIEACYWPTPRQQLFFFFFLYLELYCRPPYQSAQAVGWLWHVRLRFAAVSCHHWFTEGQLSFKIMYWSWQFHRPTGLSSSFYESMSFGTVMPTVRPNRTLKVKVEILS